jgi:uncharacterized protein YuzE
MLGLIEKGERFEWRLLKAIITIQTDEVAGGVALDFDSDGRLVGIDIKLASQKTDI